MFRFIQANVLSKTKKWAGVDMKYVGFGWDFFVPEKGAEQQALQD